MPTEMARSCQGWITSVTIRTPVRKARAANRARVMVTSLRRFTRSAITPPHTERRSTGPRLDKVTNPSMRTESVRLRISQSRPKMRAHMPTLEKAPPSQNKLYCGYWKAVNTRKRGTAGWSEGTNAMGMNRLRPVGHCQLRPHYGDEGRGAARW